MRRSWLPVLVLLHQLDGTPMNVRTETLAIVRESRINGQCHYVGGSAVWIAGKPLCIKESREYVCAILEKYNHDDRCVDE